MSSNPHPFQPSSSSSSSSSSNPRPTHPSPSTPQPLLDLQHQITTFYYTIAQKTHQATYQRNEVYIPTQSDLITHISLHITAMKALLGPDPELHMAYATCDQYLNTIRKAFVEVREKEEEEAKRGAGAGAGAGVGDGDGVGGPGPGTGLYRFHGV